MSEFVCLLYLYSSVGSTQDDIHSAPMLDPPPQQQSHEIGEGMAQSHPMNELLWLWVDLNLRLPNASLS